MKNFAWFAAVLLWTLASGAVKTASAASVTEAQMVVHVDRPGPVIHREVYGQFAEQLGRGIDEGIWVGVDSPIPNIHGYRKDVVDALKAIRVPVIRWPGGCYADEYHWRDGVGPPRQRPVRPNQSWGGEDHNVFGTHEFMDFAELVGAEAYIGMNVGGGSPREMADWLEYLTADGASSLAVERRSNGRDKPWKLDYVGVGNEAWGCGGHMRPSYYADLYRQFATFARSSSGTPLSKVASGANADGSCGVHRRLWRALLHIAERRLEAQGFGHGVRRGGVDCHATQRAAHGFDHQHAQRGDGQVRSCEAHRAGRRRMGDLVRHRTRPVSAVSAE
jgi:alpha-N-arabinofuranosidase